MPWSRVRQEPVDAARAVDIAVRELLSAAREAAPAQGSVDDKLHTAYNKLAPLAGRAPLTTPRDPTHLARVCRRLAFHIRSGAWRVERFPGAGPPDEGAVGAQPPDGDDRRLAHFELRAVGVPPGSAAGTLLDLVVDASVPAPVPGLRSFIAEAAEGIRAGREVRLRSLCEEAEGLPPPPAPGPGRPGGPRPPDMFR
ncbi:hypothetical protein [Streptomyces flavofungini]|uniref:hypothetical protein n=1 Tax=Streptomyces flavofungini TaxID=68200 RepID=UPI0034DF8000